MGFSSQVHLGPIKLDLGQRISEKFNPSVATKMVQKQNPLLMILKIGEYKSLGEDFSIGTLVQKLVHNYSLSRIKLYTFKIDVILRPL